MVGIYFEWHVADQGYGWLKTNDPLKRLESNEYLTDDWKAETVLGRVRRYHPLTEFTGLCRTLADTSPDRDSVQQFADRYGPLLGGSGDAIVLPHRPSEKGQRKGHLIGIGEPLNVWHSAIMKLREVMDIWDKVQNRDLEALQAHINWREKLVTFESHPDHSIHDFPKDKPFPKTGAWIAGEKYRPDVFQSFARGDLIGPAIAHIQRVVNENLKDGAAPRLLWNNDQTAVSVHLVPKNLLGAIWLQVASAIERESSFRQCVQCGTWFEVSRQAGRSDKRYCSNACRIRAHRSRTEPSRESQRQTKHPASKPRRPATTQGIRAGRRRKS